MNQQNQIITNQSNFFLSMLTILFIGLKLCNVIDWSWWWVLSPIWIPASYVLICFIIYVIIISFLKNLKEK